MMRRIAACLALLMTGFRFEDRSESTSRSVGVLGVMEVEVRATPSVSVFAALRIELRDARDSESAFGSPGAGVRFGF
jgi:hypothetical protein